MNEINKFLTVAMGEEWTDWKSDGKPCLLSDIDINIGKDLNYFYTPDGFFKLWNWAQTQEWFPDCVEDMDMGDVIEVSDGSHTFDIQSEFINPERFATAVYEFLKEQTR